MPAGRNPSSGIPTGSKPKNSTTKPPKRPTQIIQPTQSASTKVTELPSLSREDAETQKTNKAIDDIGFGPTIKQKRWQHENLDPATFTGPDSGGHRLSQAYAERYRKEQEEEKKKKKEPQAGERKS
ncbi:hypothetical protein BGAL_0434g00050 [Botrytis galanthina]|uniref:Uncharacterized protein n=1 Tax=Botrytis galanthina TaxID=278940 RepID=A0A4S8QLZ1_9HELO|nr:hypothetical protein BGAL_0434g00050 [Botrytis galanthina]